MKVSMKYSPVIFHSVLFCNCSAAKSTRAL